LDGLMEISHIAVASMGCRLLSRLGIWQGKMIEDEA
jgi:hypothetical protein